MKDIANENLPIVFCFGSLNMREIPEEVLPRIAAIVKKGLHVVIGDAPGADYMIQAALNRLGHRHVTVFFATNKEIGVDGPRFKVNPAWDQHTVDTTHRGRKMYEMKDMAMQIMAQCGLGIWDGNSQGTRRNVEILMQDKKPCLVWNDAKAKLTQV